MSNPFVGEIRMFGGNFAPLGWAFCDGTLLSISEYEVLFNLIGTTYGGDGQNTFALPDLRGRVPIHQGSNQGSTYVIGQLGGAESVTLTPNQLPAHSHQALVSSSAATSNTPVGNVWANWTGAQYSDLGADTTMNPAAIGPVGGNQPHDNMVPFLAVNFIISLFGVFPSQN